MARRFRVRGHTVVRRGRRVRISGYLKKYSRRRRR